MHALLQFAENPVKDPVYHVNGQKDSAVFGSNFTLWGAVENESGHQIDLSLVVVEVTS